MALILACAIGLFLSTFKTSRRNTQAGSIALFVFFSFIPLIATGGGIILSYYLELGIDEKAWQSVGSFLAAMVSPIHYIGQVMNETEEFRNPIPVKYIVTSNISFVVFIFFFYRMIYRRFKKIWFYGFQRISLKRLITKKVV
jgi:hypothetical protein